MCLTVKKESGKDCKRGSDEGLGVSRGRRDFLEVAELLWALTLSQISAGRGGEGVAVADATTCSVSSQAAKGAKRLDKGGSSGGWGKTGGEGGAASGWRKWQRII